MIIKLTAPDIDKMPRMDWEEIEAQRDPSYLWRRYQDWLKTSYDFEIEIVDIPQELIEVVRQKVSPLLLSDLCFEVLNLTWNEDGAFGCVRIGGLTREKSEKVADILRGMGMLRDTRT